jgi:hypothetical protein
MSILDLMTTPVTIEHIADVTTDTYGNAAPSIGSTDDVLGYLEPMSEVVHLVESDTLVTTHQLILPPDVALTADDTVIVDGVSYRVIEALHVSNARTGIDHHIEGRVVQVSG